VERSSKTGTRRDAGRKSKMSKSIPITNPVTSPAARLKTALECAKIGMRVAPLHGTKDGICTCGAAECKRPGQHVRMPKGIDDATSKPEKIKKFYSRYPKAKLAIATGVAGMIALKVTGEAALEALAEDLGWTDTVEIRAGKSRIFLWKVEGQDIPDGSVPLSKGVRVFGRGRFIIAPNDLASKSGRHFAGPPGVFDIAEAPGWLLRRLRPRLHGINPKPWSEGSGRVKFECQPIDVKCIVGPLERRPDPAVRLRATSIRETGPRMPPAVRRLETDDTLYEVLTDRCQVEALKSLGAKTIDCIVVEADEDGGELWQFAELFNQPQKTVLERAELATRCLQLIRSKGGQSAHLEKGKQRHDRGMSTAECLLGVSRRDLGRYEKIACNISEEAKTEIRAAELDDLQVALLAIAKVPRHEQVEKVAELKELYSKPRGARSLAANSPGSTDATTNEADTDDSAAVPVGSSKSTPSTPAATDEVVEESEIVDEGPPTVPKDDEPECPPADRKKKVQALKRLWDKHLAPEWKETDTETRVCFVTQVQGVGAPFTAHEEAMDIVRKTIDGREWIHAKELYANTDEHGFSRRLVRGACAFLEYRLKKKGRSNYDSWIYKAIDKDRVARGDREVDEEDMHYDYE
jgi:hypothetical protein